jgi:hypothetical protein
MMEFPFLLKLRVGAEWDENAFGGPMNLVHGAVENWVSMRISCFAGEIGRKALSK